MIKLNKCMAHNKLNLLYTLKMACQEYKKIYVTIISAISENLTSAR